MENAPLSIWTVYDKPKDYPTKFVARRWVGPTPTSDMLMADDLESLRQQLPPGLIHLMRNDGDDQVIVETWI